MSDSLTAHAAHPIERWVACVVVGVVCIRVVLPVAFPLKDCSSEFVVMEVGMGPRSASAESAVEKARSKWVSDFDDRIVPVCDAAAASVERVLEKKRSNWTLPSSMRQRRQRRGLQKRNGGSGTGLRAARRRNFHIF